ncbi:MAG: glycoside hydrolase family 140 protein [Sedimentisphaerales bacterium]|nr:glycoside hydrolase family 140 protein [Sedimentisphaerales bacterium]
MIRKTRRDNQMRKFLRLFTISAMFSLVAVVMARQKTQQFSLTTSGHHLLNNGQPFFWLGDTAWLLVKRGHEDVEYYMANRSSKGFTVIQMMAIRVNHNNPEESAKQPVQNYAGESPFTALDPVTLNQAYWRHVDFIIETARKHGLVIALAAMWGQDAGSLFPDPLKNNYLYGKLLSERYKNSDNLIWLVTGEYEKINKNWRADNQVISDKQRQLLRAVARGLEAGHGGRHLMTIHPVGTSSDDFHNDTWLDFNMQQTWGHQAANVIRIGSDYRLTPVKPVLNGEPGYENRPEEPTSSAWKCRCEAYWSVFSGAFGFTYGADRVWQCGGEWRDALEYEAASDMQHLRRLMESRPIQRLVPDQSILRSDAGDTRKDASYCAVLRSIEPGCAMVYCAKGLPFAIDLSKISGATLNAWWYSPRDGLPYSTEFEQIQTPFATLHTKGTHTFTPPSTGQNQDWVLILDDAVAGFPTPGTRM